MTENSRSCTRCGAALSAAAAAGLCPRCLMALNFDSNTLPEGEELPGLPPMSPEELAAKFPQYEILECLGRGGMGVVYKARQKSLKRTVAIKILAPEREHDSSFAGRFAHEAELLAKLNHPNIVTIHDFGETEGLFYLVMEYVDGVNLRELLREGRMQPEQALAIVPPVCEALEYAHGKGVVHRDIKPENLLLDREGRVKIADFGIASLVAATGEHSGTPPYMAPEQEGGRVDRRADIYALGVVLYEMLTGERPAQEVVAPSRKVQIEVGIDEIVLRALEKEPQRRYQSAAEFKTMVETMASMSGVPPMPEEEPVKAAPRRRKWHRFYSAFASAFSTLWFALFLTGVATQTYIDLGLFGLIGFPLLSLLYAAWRIRPAAKPFGRVGRIYESFSACFGTLILLVFLAALATLSKFKVGTPGLAGAAAFSLVYALWRERRAGPGEPIEAKPINWARWGLGLFALALAAGISAIIYQMPWKKTKSANFAPEVQRVMLAYPSGVNRFIDFDTGAVLSLPPAIAAQLGDDDALWMLHGSKAPPQDYLDWIDRSGADAFAMRDSLVIFNRACSAGHGASNTGWGGDWLRWNAINAGDVAKGADIIERECDRVAAESKGPPQPGSHSSSAEGLTTASNSGPGARVSIVTCHLLTGIEGHGQLWIFKTRRGSKGAFVFDENELMCGRKQLRLKLVADTAVMSAPPYDYAKEPLENLRFDPTLECEIPETLDLDTGDRMQKGHTPEYVFTGLNPDLVRENGCSWMGATGMDLVAIPGSGQLKATAMKCVLLAGEAWETLSSSQLQRALADARLEDVQSLADANSAPRIWAFQTREGSMGLLQVAGRGPEGYKLRYKLLELPANAAVNTSFFRELAVPETAGGTDTPDQVLAATPADLLDGALVKRMILYRHDLAMVHGVKEGFARGIVLGCVNGQWRPLPDASLSFFGPGTELTRTFKERTGEFMAKLRKMPVLESDRVLTPVIEKSISRQQLGEDGTTFFSFASGKLLPPPHRISYPAGDYDDFEISPSLKRWMEENQADLLIRLMDTGWKVFRFMPRERGFPDPQPMIEGVSVGDVVLKLGDKPKAFAWDPWPLRTSSNAYNPSGGSLMWFWTRESLTGVYTLRGFDDASGQGLKLRYRLVVPSMPGAEKVEGE